MVLSAMECSSPHLRMYSLSPAAPLSSDPTLSVVPSPNLIGISMGRVGKLDVHDGKGLRPTITTTQGGNNALQGSILPSRVLAQVRLTFNFTFTPDCPPGFLGLESILAPHSLSLPALFTSILSLGWALHDPTFQRKA